MTSKDKPGGGVLTRGQMAMSIALGLVLWFGAALTVQFGARAGWFGGIGLVAMYGLCLPLSLATVWLVKRLAGLGPAQVVPGVVMGTVAATFCDGFALNWARGLYGASADLVLPGAGWILWGAGWVLLAAYWDGARRTGARLES